MTAPEVRAGAEFRVAGRTLTGCVMTYGDISQEHRERFLPGAFAPVPDIPLNIQHDKNMRVLDAGEFVLNDTPRALEIRAELPADSAALSLVKRGALNGFSVEFHARAERREAGGVRVIERAHLVGIGLVDEPSYTDSQAEVRRRGGGGGGRLFTARGRIPKGKRVDCRCSPGDCKSALFDDGAFDNVTRDQARDVLAVVGDYSQAVASRKRRSLRFWEGEDGSLEFAIDIENSERGRALQETMDAVDTFARPVLDVDASTFTREGTLARYTDARIRALTLGPTDAAAGWAPLRLRDGDDDDKPEPRSAEVSSRDATSRRVRVWLP